MRGKAATDALYCHILPEREYTAAAQRMEKNCSTTIRCVDPYCRNPVSTPDDGACVIPLQLPTL